MYLNFSHGCRSQVTSRIETQNMSHSRDRRHQPTHRDTHAQAHMYAAAAAAAAAGTTVTCNGLYVGRCHPRVAATRAASACA